MNNVPMHFQTLKISNAQTHFEFTEVQFFPVQVTQMQYRCLASICSVLSEKLLLHNIKIIIQQFDKCLLHGPYLSAMWNSSMSHVHLWCYGGCRNSLMSFLVTVIWILHQHQPTHRITPFLYERPRAHGSKPATCSAGGNEYGWQMSVALTKCTCIMLAKVTIITGGWPEGHFWGLYCCAMLGYHYPVSLTPKHDCFI